MMVLASVYLSVSASLPTTSDIKPVELWLLVNLAFPGLVILLQVVLQVLEEIITKDPAERTGKDAGRKKGVKVFLQEEKKKSFAKEKSLMKYLRFVLFYINPIIYVLFTFIYFIAYN